MDRTFYNPDNKLINYQINNLQHTQETFKAFVDAIVPRTPRLAEEYGRIQYYGALDLYTEEYLIMSINNYYISLAEPTAEMLDVAAEQLILIQGNEGQLNFSMFPGGGTFAALAPNDRLRALTLLEQLQVNLSVLPIPFQDNPGFVLFVTVALNRLTMMGYYSEWSGYGSTRLETPNQRILEYFPLGWEQVGYPGPSLGYRALRG